MIRRRAFDVLWATMTVLLLASAGLFLVTLGTGCHGAERATRTALDVASHALVATDATVAATYRDRAHVALREATSLDDYRQRMARLNRAEEALRATHAALLSAEAVVDTADAHAVPRALACAREAINQLRAALDAAGLDPPASLRRSLDAFESIPLGACVEGAVAEPSSSEADR